MSSGGNDGPGGVGATAGMEGLGAFGGIGSGGSVGALGAGDPNAGGGPDLRGQLRRYKVVPKQQTQPAPFMIDPNQVLNDIALGSGWGMPTMMPQMNPMGMIGMNQNPFGMQQMPFNWGNLFQTFGGK